MSHPALATPRPRLLLVTVIALVGVLVLLGGCSGGSRVTSQRLPELKARNTDLVDLEIPGTERSYSESTDDEQRNNLFNRPLRVTVVYRPTTGTAEHLKAEIIELLEEAGWAFMPRDDLAVAYRDIDEVLVSLVEDSADPRVAILLEPRLITLDRD